MPKDKKTKSVFHCRDCGAMAHKWSGQCAACMAWNTLEEELAATSPGSAGSLSEMRMDTYETDVHTQNIDAVQARTVQRMASGIGELDRVLGGGLTAGSVTLIGGDPGIGKSTLLLQTLGRLATMHKVLYVSGEESAEQIALHAKRLEVDRAVRLLCSGHLERVLQQASKEAPRIMTVDSIQTMMTEHLSSAPGSVAQVRESTAALVRFAKSTNCAVILIGHVTKEGQLAGPRLLEHMVDTVLYFEGDGASSFRLVRAIKNRYGALHEVGVFAMTDRGLQEVSNPSAMFVRRGAEALPGSVVFATREGTRPLLVEVQALVDLSALANPKRLAVGMEANRVAMILAVLQRIADCRLYDRDVFTNVVGGIRVSETGLDVALALAIYSSLKGVALPNDTVVFGELGLSGEVRPVQGGQERLREALNLGFKRAVIPRANAPRKNMDGLKVISVTNINEVLSVCQNEPA